MVSSKLFKFCVFLVLVFCAGAALAQTATSTGAPDITKLIDEGKAVYVTYQDLGLLAAIAAATKLLVDLTKIGFVNDFIESKNIYWIRYVLAAVVAGLASAVAMQGEHKSPATIVVASLVTAVASPGMNELVKQLASLKKKS